MSPAFPLPAYAPPFIRPTVSFFGEQHYVESEFVEPHIDLEKLSDKSYLGLLETDNKVVWRPTLTFKSMNLFLLPQAIRSACS